MSKKWMTVAGIVALVAVVLIAVAVLSTRKTPLPATSATGVSGTASSTTSSAAVATTSPATNTVSSTTSSGAGATGSQGGKSANPSNGGSTSSGQNGSGQKTTADNALKPFPPMPDPGVDAQNLTSPAAVGQTLPPLIAAPKPTLYALKTGQIFSRSTYDIVMRPYGRGPSSVWGSGLVIKVDSATPVGATHVYKKIIGANILVIVDTNDGGTVTKGGTYSAVLTWRSDGTKLLPILSKAKLKN